MARSRLYRSRFLQVNIRWKALDEIYKIYMLLHSSDLNISEKYFSKFSSRIFENFSQIFKQHRQNCSMFVPICAETPLHQILSEFYRFFRNFFHNPYTENLKKILGFFLLRTKIIWYLVSVHLIFKNALLSFLLIFTEQPPRISSAQPTAAGRFRRAQTRSSHAR